MRRWLILLSELTLVMAAIVIAVFIFRHPDRHDDKTAPTTSNQTIASSSQKPACKYFTINDARQLLGDDAKAGTNPIYDSNGTNIYASSCTYTNGQGTAQPAGATTGSKQSATLLVRQPASDKGQQNIQNQFGPLKPTGVQDVAGYGDGAYWDMARGELNIFKSNNWYVLSIGPSTPADRTLDQTKTMADQLLSKL